MRASRETCQIVFLRKPREYELKGKHHSYLDEDVTLSGRAGLARFFPLCGRVFIFPLLKWFGKSCEDSIESFAFFFFLKLVISNFRIDAYEACKY